MKRATTRQSAKKAASREATAQGGRRAARVTNARSPAAAGQGIAKSAAEFRRLLHVWYRKHARTLPWRGVTDPYATWLSEIMLQQTRVATVIERYRAFMLCFPTIAALAAAPESDVLALWSGLGYYRRARMLQRGAQFVVRELNGVLPCTAPELRTLPGVGAYTSAAIASIAFGESVAVVDGNVERVLLRVMGIAEDKSAATQTLLQRAAQQLVPAAARDRARSNPPGDHNQAMMELGATVCLPRAPLCLQCPVFDLCVTRGAHPTQGRQKQQSRSVAHLLSVRKAGTTTEVLLERRPANASLMPSMMELPPLPLDSVAEREPALRVRHAITNTNYYVQIFSESAPAVRASAQEQPESGSEDDDCVVASEQWINQAHAIGPRKDSPASLLDQISAAPPDLTWMPCKRLHDVPLTGLARKVLQRLGVMTVPEVKGTAMIRHILPTGD